MGKNQLIALSVSIAAILVFYFGCDNLSQSQQEISQTRSKNLQVTDIQNLLNEAKASMSETSLGEISVNSIGLLITGKLLKVEVAGRGQSP